MKKITCVCLIPCLLMSSITVNSAETPRPPLAKVVPKILAQHGLERLDPYYWLNERENPEVIEYLEAENEYREKVMAHAQPLEDALFDEIVGRIKKDDSSVPYRKNGYYYYTRFEEGDEHAIFCRKKGSLQSGEQIMLDSNDLAKGHDFFSVRASQVSADNRILAVATDTVGRRIYTIRFRDLDTETFLKDEIPDVTGTVAWAEDEGTLFYSKQDPETLRSFQIYRHRLGTDVSENSLVYEEKDETFTCTVFKSKSKRFMMIASYQTVSTEYRYLDAKDPDGEFQVFLPRERDHEYTLDHYDDSFYLLTNLEAKNFRLMSTPVNQRGKEHWKEVIPHREEVLLENFEIFRDFLVVSERNQGLVQMRIRPWAGAEEHYLDFGEPAYMAFISTNPEFDTDTLRFGYTSLTTPRSTFDYDMKTREKNLLKQEPVLGGFEREHYQTERLWAMARDGAKVPISLVYRRGTPLDGTSPTLLYGYGSYGLSMEAAFNSARLSLLDRGFVYAIAHIRGGEEMGRAWYETGKLLQKKNTFYDFIDCGLALVERKISNPDRLFAMGGSAGGLLMGAVINLRPDLFTGVVAAVPFVDVVTTMLDDSIPLTTGEYDEWGNPNEKPYFDYMLSYSPYDNVTAQEYPHLLITAGLHDSQVQYWEPAKWIAKLRARKVGDQRLLLYTNMDAGHGGASGRFARHRETAMEYAFLLDLCEITR